MLRIIAGKYRHLAIKVPSGNLTRPTTDKVREALMSALGENLNNAIVLDLFSGSGALGIEALSRGSQKAYLIDNSSLSIKTIKENVSALKIENCSILNMDYKQALNYFRDKKIKFDIIFIDPPYIKTEVYPYVRKFMVENNLLNPHAILVEESNEELKGNYGESRYYKYGKIHVKITKELKK